MNLHENMREIHAQFYDFVMILMCLRVRVSGQCQNGHYVVKFHGPISWSNQSFTILTMQSSHFGYGGQNGYFCG